MKKASVHIAHPSSQQRRRARRPPSRHRDNAWPRCCWTPVWGASPYTQTPAAARASSGTAILRCAPRFCVPCLPSPPLPVYARLCNSAADLHTGSRVDRALNPGLLGHSGTSCGRRAWCYRRPEVRDPLPRRLLASLGLTSLCAVVYSFAAHYIYLVVSSSSSLDTGARRLLDDIPVTTRWCSELDERCEASLCAVWSCWRMDHGPVRTSSTTLRV